MSKKSLQKKPKTLKLFRPPNYNTNYNKDDQFIPIIYVEPVPQKEKNRDIFYQIVNNEPKYAQYWSNNWRKTHGYPLLRKPLRNRYNICFKPYLASEELTNQTNNVIKRLDEIFAEDFL